MRAAYVSVACPVRIDPTGIRKFSAASKLNAFVVCTSKISKDIISCRHVRFACHSHPVLVECEKAGR